MSALWWLVLVGVAFVVGVAVGILIVSRMVANAIGSALGW